MSKPPNVPGHREADPDNPGYAKPTALDKAFAEFNDAVGLRQEAWMFAEIVEQHSPDELRMFAAGCERVAKAALEVKRCVEEFIP